MCNIPCLRRTQHILGSVVVAVCIFVSPSTFGAQKDVLQAVVAIKTQVPDDARTAKILGTERRGSGVVIDNQGLVLTIGYLIIEANNITVTGHDGSQTTATVVAYDHETGLGLIRMPKKINIKPMRLGNSSQLSEEDHVLIAARGSQFPVSGAQVVSRRVFTGYWEYMLEKAIFTSPPHSFHSGAALVGKDGKLLGIGSLLVNDAATPNVPFPGNMFVPVDELKPILADLLQNGRRAGPKRPWIGANTYESNGRIFVSRISKNGPADMAGISVGDLILGVSGRPIRSHEDFYRKLWSAGEAGQLIKLSVIPKAMSDLKIKEFNINSGDRYEWLNIRRSF